MPVLTVDCFIDENVKYSCVNTPTYVLYLLFSASSSQYWLNRNIFSNFITLCETCCYFSHCNISNPDSGSVFSASRCVRFYTEKNTREHNVSISCIFSQFHAALACDPPSKHLHPFLPCHLNSVAVQLMRRTQRSINIPAELRLQSLCCCEGNAPQENSRR